MTFPSSLRSKNANIQRKGPTTLRPKEKKETTQEAILENVKEIPGQFVKGYATGGLGTPGNILDILGLQTDRVLPGEEAKRKREFETLERIDKGGIPSLAEFEELSDDDVLPRYSRLPTSPEVKSFLEELGTPKAKRVGGRYAERIGQFAAPPGGGLKAPTAMGIAGQTAEEAGLPPWAQAVAELGTSLKFGKSKVPVSSGSKHIQQELDNLKEMGFSERDLTLARNALEDRGFLKKTAKYTREAEKSFKQTNQNFQKKFESILEQSFPGIIQEGSQPFKEAGSELFDSLDNFAREVSIEKPQIFVKEARKAINEMQKTLAEIPQKKQVISLLEEAIEKAVPLTQSFPTGDYYTNFYKDLNSIGNWGNPKQREHVFKIIKDAIKNTFRNQGPEGVKLADALEEANKSWIKYLNTEDIANLLGKVNTEEGMNFKKLSNLLQKSENLKIFEQGLGIKQTQNLKKLSEAASSLDDFEKKIKGGIAKDILGQGTLYGIAKAVLTGDLSALKTIIGVQTTGILATKMLTDPKYQNIILKMGSAAKDNKWNIVKSLSHALELKLKKTIPSEEPKSQ